MSSFKLSSIETARISQEEKAKLRIQRLNKVRDSEKLLAAQRRKAVEEEKNRLQQHFLVRFKHQWQSNHLEEIIRLEETLKCNLLEIGESHRKAEALNIDGLNEEKALHNKENRQKALKKYNSALSKLRDEKEKEAIENSQNILARSYALDIEKSRAAMIASLPKPRQVQPVPEVNNEEKKIKIPRTTTIDVIVEKENYDSIQTNAADNAVLCERNLETREEERERMIKEGREKALQRHKEALERELKQRNEENELRYIEEFQKNRIAEKKALSEIQSKQILANNLKHKERAEREAELRKRNEKVVLHLSSDVLNVTAESDILDGEEEQEAGRITPIDSDDEAGLLANYGGRKPDGDAKSVVAEDSNARIVDHSMVSKFQLSPDAMKKLHEKIELQKNDWLKLQQSKTEKKDAMLQTDDHSPFTSGRMEEQTTSTSDDYSLETSNSYVPQFRSVPNGQEKFRYSEDSTTRSRDNFQNVEDEAELVLEKKEIEKKKMELLHFLKLIEEQKRILEEQNSALCDSSAYDEDGNASTSMIGDSPARTSLGSFSNLPPVRSAVQMTSPSSEGSTTYLEMPQSARPFNERDIIPSIVIPHFLGSMESSEIFSKEPDEKESYLFADKSSSSVDNSGSTKYYNLPVNQNSLISNNIRSTFDDSSKYNDVEVNRNDQSLAFPTLRPLPIITNDTRIQYNQQGRNGQIHEVEECHSNEHRNLNYTCGLETRSANHGNHLSSCCDNSNEVSVLDNCPWETSSIISHYETESSETSLCRSSISSAGLHEKASWLYKSLEIPDDGPTDLHHFCDCTSLSISAPYDDFINSNINNNNDCSCSDVTLSEIKDPSFSEDSLVKNWAEIFRPYQENVNEVSESLSLSEHSMESSSACSEELLLSHAGILEEPDLTLVSCDTTLSSVVNASALPPEPPHDSIQVLDSLLSFEKHELSIANKSDSSLIPTFHGVPSSAGITKFKQMPSKTAATHTSSMTSSATKKIVEQSKPSTSKVSVVRKVPLVKPNAKTQLLIPDARKLQADMKATLDNETNHGSSTLSKERLPNGRETD